jgi:uncharacterized membrane protein YqjE
MLEESAQNNSRSFRSLLNETKQELKQFLNTRIEILKSELRETLSAVRVAVPLGVLALVFAGTGFLVLTAAAVAIVASAFAGNPYAWFFALVIVGVLWTAFGAIAAFFAYNSIRSKGMFPRRTLAVLKADKLWLESNEEVIHERAA